MDIALLFRDTGIVSGPRFIDLALETKPGNTNDLQKAHDLETAVIISLFTDRRARLDDELPHDAGLLAVSARRGWWGDYSPPVVQDQIGSRLWLLSREKTTQQTLNRAKEYCQEALAWLIDDGIANLVEVTTEYYAKAPIGIMAIRGNIWRPNQVSPTRFEYVWNQFNGEVLDVDPKVIAQQQVTVLATEAEEGLTTESGTALIL